MDVWDDLLNDLWPEGANEEGVGISYLRGRLDRKLLGKAAALRLATDLGAESAASLQTDWDWHYRFVYVLLAPIILNPEDPAQWFVDLGLNKYQQKARDVLRNIAIVEQRHTVMAALLPQTDTEPADINAAVYDFIKVQAFLAWTLARWAMQIIVGLHLAGKNTQSTDLLNVLPQEHRDLLARYVAALGMVVVAGKQAALEAIDRPA